ncbi:zinc knuckle CX2CX4HX4C containing protein [Tanacetum coccineum]
MENHGESNKREVLSARIRVVTEGEALLHEVAEHMNMLTGTMDPAIASLPRMATRILKNPSLELHTPSVQVSHVDEFRVRLSLMTSVDYNEDDPSLFGIDFDQANVVSNYATSKGMFNMSSELNTSSMRTHDDVVSSSLHLPSVHGTAIIIDLFGVPLNTPGDIDKLTRYIELGKYEVWSDLPSDKHTEVIDTICSMWDAFMAENLNVTGAYSSDSGKSEPLESMVKGSTNIDDTIHVDESLIVQSVIVQGMPNSYVGAAGGLKPVPSKSKANFRSLFLENLSEGANFSIPRKVVETVSTQFANTLYGYFIGKCMAFLIVEYYVQNNWGKYGLTRIMMNFKGFFIFQFKTFKGLEDVLENGPWMIRNSPIILKKWTMNTCLCKEELTRIPVWVKIHDVPIQSLTMGVPLIKGSRFTIETVTIEYECKPPRCDLCKIFGHVHDHFPKKVSVPPIDVTHNAVTPTVEKTSDGIQTVGKKEGYEPKASTSIPKKGATNLGNASKSLSMLKNQPLKATIPSTKEGNSTMSNSYAALDDESDEDVENVYDESANLLHSLKIGGSLSTFTVVAG